MAYEISFGRSTYGGDKYYPFVTNLKTRSRAEIELSDLIPVGSPVRDPKYSRRCRDSASREAIIQGIPEGANAFYLIDFWFQDPPINSSIVQYYHVNERFHKVSNLP